MPVAVFFVLFTLVVGLLMWFCASSAKLQEAGKICFSTAMIALMFQLAPAVAHLLSH